jgi:hypothetical protein
MTEPSHADLTAVDLALDVLAERRRTTGDASPAQPHHAPDDPALTALAGFAHHIDTRAQALDRQHPTARLLPTAAPSAPAQARLNGRERHPPARPRIPRRLLAVPAAVALTLLIAVPLSASPGTPLHPLHQLIFQHGTPSPADNARLNLANAKEALDRAGTDGPTRAASILQAHGHFAQARTQIALITDPTIRAELDAELSTLEQRARQLADSERQQDGEKNTGRASDSTRPGGNSQPGPDSTHTTGGPDDPPSSQNGPGNNSERGPGEATNDTAGA